MTIICAVKDPETGTIWLGSNSLHRRGDEVVPSANSKWKFYGNWALATSGSSVHSYILEADGETLNSREMTVNDIISQLKAIYQRNDIKAPSDEQDSESLDYGAYILLAHSTGVYGIDRHLTPHKIDDGFMWTAGSGADFARGADHSAKRLNQSCEVRVKLAIEAAIASDIGCPGNMIVEQLQT